ncbi:MAG: aminotransferase class I/II-fold pyridoxal phosphate-dependent enzyme [Spirochaetales bacterium]|nr:aminotransferase class I/II-fold pyridoxal phosphate-dependent enzyme [Spirochaetales bacterium]
MKIDKEGLATRSVHSGEKSFGGSPHTPVFNTTTFAFETTEQLLDVVDGRTPGSLYTRYGMNPSIVSLEEKMATLEQAESALLFASGMAAEAALFLALGRRGVVCLGDAYGGTMELLGVQLRSLGIPVHFLLGSEIDQLGELLKKGAGMVFFETPTNPTLEIFDIQALAGLTRAHGALSVVDNTFATPVNQNPLLLGADLVVHSATKYLGGHSDVTAGVVMGPQNLLAEIRPWRKNLGQVLAPETAALLARSVRSLVPRVRWQNQSALQIAAALEGHPAIRKVLYPGLPGFPNHSLAVRQMTGFGGMMTLDLKTDLEGCTRMADALRIFRIAPSLGGAESLATQPVTTTHHGLDPAERLRRGISDTMIRLSIGLEDAEDLLADLNQALSRLKPGFD